MTLRSCAKINVFLEVLGKRDDGFHELETVMLRTQFCDVMHFRRTDGNEVSLRLSTLTDPQWTQSFPLDSSNLILKAASALLRHVGATSGAEITIQKRIPAEAGLAGGSSNAATTLLGLNELWNLNVPKSELHAIAATLGSDINFFVEDCRAAICRGRGELVLPIQMAGTLHVVALKPESGNSTPTVFSRLKLPETHRTSSDVQDALRLGNSRRLVDVVFNRLAQPAREVNLEMADLMDDVSEQTSYPVFMSGSGSTCFLIAKTAREAQTLSVRLRSLGYEVFGPLLV